jgi:phosphate:Na+ symporter
VRIPQFALYFPLKLRVASMQTLFDILSIFGALGLFIFGMKVMSESVQRAAGASMRRIVSAMTRSQSRAVFTGIATTSLIQSSSATTVMVVSFVNAGILKLREAVGVIMGANIGTTVTAWVIAFALGRVDIRALALPMIALALPFLFMKRARFRYSSETVIGFALMLIGLQLLQSALPAIQGTPDFFNYLAQILDGHFASPALFLLIGTLVTVIVQSSTAAIALTLAMLANGILPIELAAAMVLGENIGTTVTANIAAIVANRQAKRAARAHLIVNVIGASWMLFLLPTVVRSLTGWLDESFADLDGNRDAVLIAIFHSGFNIINVILLFGFTDQIVSLTDRLVRKSKNDDQVKLEYIGSAVMGTPELAILEAQKEMRRYARVVKLMNDNLRKLLDENDPAERAELIRNLRNGEEVTDRFAKEITKYLTELARQEVSDSTSLHIRGLLSAASDLERIGDLYIQVAMNLEDKSLQKVYFVPRQRQSLKEMTSLLAEAFAIMLDNLKSEQESVDTAVAKRKEEEVNALRDELRLRHLKDVTRDKYSLESGVFYSDTFSALEEIADYIFSVSEGLSMQD